MLRAINAKTFLKRAVHCDKADRLLEAQYHYHNGIQLLKDLMVHDDELNLPSKKLYYEHLNEYVEREKKIKKRLQTHLKTGDMVANISIAENAMGHSYKSLFGKFLTADVKEIYLDEPYLHQGYQVENLVVFLELAVKKCQNLKFILLLTKRVGQMSDLEGIKEDLLARGITLAIDRDQFLHDRKIALSNGFIIKIGRGLHFYKAARGSYSLGVFDRDFRNCMKTDVDIWRSAATS